MQFDGGTHSEVYGVAMLQIRMYVPYMFAQKYKRSLGCNKNNSIFHVGDNMCC